PELSSIIVPTDTPGFTAGPSYDKVGWHTSDTHPLLLEDVRVPEENLLGERGRGFSNFLTILDQGRVAFAALGVGAAQGCLEQAVDYAKRRVVFGRPLGERQHIAFTLARMQSRVAAARALMHETARRLDAGMPFSREASMAKLVCSEAATANARDACQIWGGNGFLNENVVARHYRDSRVLEVGEGSTEVQLGIIAGHLGFPNALAGRGTGPAYASCRRPAAHVFLKGEAVLMRGPARPRSPGLYGEGGAAMAVRRQVLRAEVEELILQRLLESRWAPGSRLSIDGLARDLEVSPTPVREAMVSLERS